MTQTSTAVQTLTHPVTNAPESPTAISSPAPVQHLPIYVHKPAAPAQPPPLEIAEPAPPLADLAPAAVPPAKPAMKPLTSPRIKTSNSPWCMTYSPYTESGNCKSSSAIASDVASIAAKGFSSIRIYSTD
ncbi:MAG: hypothetical protein Q9177_005076, partial [Variospora cf. flavescens]